MKVASIQTVATDDGGGDALLTDLLDQWTALVVDATIEDDVWLVDNGTVEDAREVTFGGFDTGFVRDFATGSGDSLGEERGDARTVGGLVVQDVVVLAFERLDRVIGGGWTLHIVTSANAVGDFGGAFAIRDQWVGVGWADHDQTDLGVNLARGDRHAGVQVSDHAEDIGVIDDLVGVGRADVRLGLIVVGLVAKFVAL